MDKKEQLQNQLNKAQEQLDKAELNVEKIQKSLIAARSEVRVHKKKVEELSKQIDNQKKIDFFDKLTANISNKEISENVLQKLTEHLESLQKDD